MDLPVWNVYYHNSNKDQIIPYNVFEHGGIRKDIYNAVKQEKNKEEFAEILRKSLMYYYWSRAEWEVIIGPLFSGHKTKEIKVDVFDQVFINWDLFVDYTWNNRKNIVYRE